jgi:hypothetical protein
MKYLLWSSLSLLALAFCLASVPAADDKDTHTGTFVSAKSDTEFVMEDKGKQHMHKLAAGAKVYGLDGKECKLADIRSGQKIRVTTQADDKTVALKVTVLKD